MKENAFLILESFKRWVGFCVRGSFSQCSFPEVPVKSFISCLEKEDNVVEMKNEFA